MVIPIRFFKQRTICQMNLRYITALRALSKTYRTVLNALHKHRIEIDLITLGQLLASGIGRRPPTFHKAKRTPPSSPIN